MSVIRVNEHVFEWSVPVVIAGGGACGLTAALAAREQDVDVLVIERDTRPYGSTGMSYGGICAAGTRAQALAGIADSPSLLYDDILAMTRGATDPALAKTLADNAAGTLDWLAEKHDVSLLLEETWTGLGHQRPRLHVPATRSGETLMALLLDACMRSDVDMLTSAHVTSLYANEDSRVLGLQLRRPDGAVEEVGCDTLIIATCGFAANEEMLHKHIPEICHARYHGHDGNDGAGILWGLELGGACDDMGSYQALGSLADPHALPLPHTLLIGGGVQINRSGKRFENELDDISGQALTILEQPGGVCWMVYDQRLHDEALERFQDYRDAAGIGAARQGSTWQQLAEEAGIDAVCLEKTMQGVDALARDNAIDEYGRRFASEDRLQPPFYAARVTGALFHTQGGLCIDSQARVVSTSGEALPNVFSGGGAARSVSGPGCRGYLPGMGLCTAVTLGRIAGTFAGNMAREHETT